MFAIVDIVNALWNLLNAAVLLDEAADALKVDAGQRQAVANTADDTWADPAWQIDSTTRTCGGRIGSHACDCETSVHAEQPMNESGCGFAECEYDHDQIPSTEHSWSATAPARAVSGKPHHHGLHRRAPQPGAVKSIGSSTPLLRRDTPARARSRRYSRTAAEPKSTHFQLPSASSAFDRIAAFRSFNVSATLTTSSSPLLAMNSP